MATENFFDGAAFGYAVGPPAEPRERAAGRGRPGSEGHHHDLLGPVRPHQRRVHRVHRQVGHQRVPRQRLRATSPTTRSTRRASSRKAGRQDAAEQQQLRVHAGRARRASEVYDGHNKTFFFTNYRLHEDPLAACCPGFGNTTPIDAFKNGDFSALLTGNQIGADALGRPIFAGQIFNPAHDRLVNGVPVRDPYPGNIIPANDPLRSVVASRIVAADGASRSCRAPPTTSPATPPATRRGSSTRGTSCSASTTASRPNFRASTASTGTTGPSIRNCGEVGGCTVPNDPETEPAKNTDYYGNGFYQRISTHHAHQQFDWIIQQQPDEPLHGRLRPLVHGRQPAVGRRGLAAAAVGEPPADRRHPRHDAGPPRSELRRQHPLQLDRPVRLAGVRVPGEQPLAVLRRPHVGQGPAHAEERVRVPPPRVPVPRLGGRAPSPASSTSIASGTGGYDASGNNLGPTGDPFASFLLGQVQSANQTIPVQPTFNESVHGARGSTTSSSVATS